MIILLPFGEFVYFFVVKIHDYPAMDGFFFGARRHKCESFRNLVAHTENGVICSANKGTVFKTPTRAQFCSFCQSE